MTSTNEDILHHRTIALTPERRNQVAIAAASLGISGARFISCAILTALVTMAQRDPVLGHMLARAGGIDWEELMTADYGDVLAKLAS